MTEARSSVNVQIARAAGTVMGAFVIGNLAGLARQVLAANAFGTTADMEAFNAANRVAETLFNLTAGGALSSAFIPTFTALAVREQQQRAWRLASATTNLVLAALTALSILAFIEAPWLVRTVLAPGFAADAYKFDLTVRLLRLMLPTAVIFGLSGMAMSVLNSYRVFLTPALAPAMYQVGLIFGILALAPRLGIYGLAWGALVGSALHLVVQAPALLRLGGRYTAALDLRSADVRRVAALMAPRLLGVAVVQLNFWVNTRLASHLAPGSVTAIVLAFSLMLMPQAAIAQSIAIAAMPTFSAQAALGKPGEMRSALAAALRAALLLSIPAAVGLIALRRPLIALLYQRGAFTAESTELAAWALLWFAAGLVGHALVEILSRAFYALQDTRTPVMVGAAAMALNVGLSYLLVALFMRRGWMGHGGLALANSLATGVEAAALWGLIGRRLGGVEARAMLLSSGRGAAAAGLMAGGLALWLALVSRSPAWLAAGGGVLFGAAIYAAALLALGASEARALAGWLRRRWAR